MIKHYFSLLLLFTLITTISIASAANDPMKSLFHFQKKMAQSGSSSAMMKMGEMYERGEGTEKNYSKALEMYQKAKIAGHAKAEQAILRLKNRKNKPKRNTSQNKAKQKKILAEEKIKKKKALAKAKAAAEAKKEAERIKLEKEKAAIQRAKAKLRAAAARKKAEKEARLKAAKLREKLAKEKIEKANKLKAERAKAAAARVKAAEKRKAETKGAFKSDPCKGKAARLLSICR